MDLKDQGCAGIFKTDSRFSFSSEQEIEEFVKYFFRAKKKLMSSSKSFFSREKEIDELVKEFSFSCSREIEIDGFVQNMSFSFAREKKDVFRTKKTLMS